LSGGSSLSGRVICEGCRGHTFAAMSFSGLAVDGRENNLTLPSPVLGGEPLAECVLVRVWRVFELRFIPATVCI
jgi:hypothetical protein